MTIPECLDIITGQKDLADQLHALRLENQRLRTALRSLLADIEEYQRLNNLGGYDNHAQVQARTALDS